MISNWETGGAVVAAVDVVVVGRDGPPSPQESTRRLDRSAAADAMTCFIVGDEFGKQG